MDDNNYHSDLSESEGSEYDPLKDADSSCGSELTDEEQTVGNKRKRTTSNSYLNSCIRPTSSQLNNSFNLNKELRATRVTSPSNASTSTETASEHQVTGALEKRIASLEDGQRTILKELSAIKSLITTESTQDSRKRKKVRTEVASNIRYAIHDGFKAGKDKGMAWTTEKRDSRMKATSDENKPLTTYIKTFVIGLYPDTTDAVFKAAIDRYFISQKERSQRVSAGKANRFRQKMVLYQRRKRKLTNRKNALLKKTSWTEETKSKLKDALIIEFMSSEEEDTLSDDETVYKVSSLPWRSTELSNFFTELDKKASSIKSPSARRQIVKRVKGLQSSRERPEVDESLNWAFK